MNRANLASGYRLKPRFTGFRDVIPKPYVCLPYSLRKCVLTLMSPKGRKRIFSKPKGSDKIFGIKPFCFTQQLKGGMPWIGFVFVCEVEDGEPQSQLSEAKDVKWVDADEVREMVTKTPEKFFGLELPAWDYYFSENLA